MPYVAKGKCVYKKNGTKVGCTKGPVKKYLAALHANVPDAKEESIEEAAGNLSSYQSACAAVAKVVAQNMLSGVSDSQVLNYDDVIAIIYGVDQKRVMAEMDTLIKQKLQKLKQRQGIKEAGHIKLSEMLTQMSEGEEEKYNKTDGGPMGANYRADHQVRYCKKCHKRFTPSYGEYDRCPECLSKDHSAGEKATGTQ